MLTAEEKKEIREEFGKYEKKSAVCIEALRIVQARRGWVSDESVADIAELLEMTPDEVDAVATFYSLVFRKPVGKNVILLCDSVSCWIKGCDKLRERLAVRLGIGSGETTSDQRFTLLPVACLGACERAPALMLNDELHCDLSSENIDRILEGA